ncbi:MAG TPA: ribonuclease HI [Tepidisphaeraceae bacterium]|jgi:ribonuclease HI
MTMPDSLFSAPPAAEAVRPQMTIYTDGACDPNPGIGGWAAILIDTEAKIKTEIAGGERESTNNRMELTAVIEALTRLPGPSDVLLITDSEYVKNAFTQGWLANWQRRGWKTADKKPVKNQDLWQKLVVLTASHRITWKWVRGHAFDVNNNRCDELAVQARLKIKAAR